MKTLEDFIEDQCGMVTPKLLEKFEPHREFIEQSLTKFSESEHNWNDYSNLMWKFLPEPKKDCF